MGRNAPGLSRRPVASVLRTAATFLMATGAAVAPPPASAQEQLDTTMDRSVPIAATWTVVNDGVMGGRSTSSVRELPSGTILFAGDVSLENNGGFASARLSIPDTDLSAFAGLRVRLRGDGKRYQIRLRPDDRFDGLAYAAPFRTTGEWETVEIPFAAFEPTFRGARPPGAPPLDPSRIRQLGLLIADRQAGPFALEVADVRAYRTTRMPPR
jgi:monofunctional biosynthetic peptidoglycan transglycosylase